MKQNDENRESMLSMTPFTKDRPTILISTSSIILNDINNLVPFKNHPFKLYEGQRFSDMVESVRTNGVLVPIVIRPAIEEEKFEILSGHNRVAAAREAGLKEIPAIIRRGLTDDEALLIVTETNLIQRSFADLKHSEKAIALATHYDAMKKKPGYRSDLLAEIEELTCAPVGHGMRTRDKIGAQYGLSKNTVARYLRVNKLTTALKARLDDDEIGMRVAEALSYLRDREQKIVDGLLDSGKKISVKQAESLKAESEKGVLNKASIEKVLESRTSLEKVKPVKLGEQLLSQYFKDNQSAEEIEIIIAEALEQYYSNQNN